MKEEEIILTNTYLNSRKKMIQTQETQNPNAVRGKSRESRKKKIKSLIWKDNLCTEHVYSTTSAVSQLPTQIQPRVIESTKLRSDSITSKKAESS